MKYSLYFLPDIEADSIRAYSWYEDKSKGLGEEFLRLFYASAIEISRNPMIYQKVYGEYRRSLLRRFPYAVYYRINDDTVTVFGLFHCARDPKTTFKNLTHRKNTNMNH